MHSVVDVTHVGYSISDFIVIVGWQKNFPVKKRESPIYFRVENNKNNKWTTFFSLVYIWYSLERKKIV